MVSAARLPMSPLYVYFWHFFPQAATVHTTSTVAFKTGFITKVFAFKMSAASVSY